MKFINHEEIRRAVYKIRYGHKAEVNRLLKKSEVRFNIVDKLKKKMIGIVFNFNR